MKMLKFRSMPAFVITAFVASLIVFAGCTKKEEKEIRIGAILPLTGEGAKYGDSAKKGINLAVKEINSTGGIKGKLLQVVYEDTQGDPKIGVTAVQKLVTSDKVSAIIGELLSSVTLAIAPIANKNGVVILSPASSSPKITDAGDFIFRNCPSDIYEGSIMANFAHEKLQYKKVAIFHINNDYGVGIKEVFKDVFVKRGGTIVDEESFEQGATDFRSQLTKIKQARPEAIYIIGYKETGYILRQAKEMGIKVQFLSTVTFEDPEILKIAMNAAEGVIYSASSFNAESDKLAIQVFVQSFKKEYGLEPDIFAGLSYDAMKIMAAAISKGGDTGEGIKSALYNTKNYPGVAGEVSFDANGDAILAPVLKKVQDGKFIFLQ